MLSRSQMNYPAPRLEFLVLKWAVVEKCGHWLKGRHFTAWTDNNPLSYILTKPRLDACEQRWVAKLAAYDFDLKYVLGTRNTVADALSREPFVRSCVSHHLMKEPYIALLDEVGGVVRGTVAGCFPALQQLSSCRGDECGHVWCSLCLTEAQSVLKRFLLCWRLMPAEDCPDCLVLLCHHYSCLGRIPLLSSHRASSWVCRNRMQLWIELCTMWDGTGSLPDRRGQLPCCPLLGGQERAALPAVGVTKLVRHWKKLKVHDGILYKVRKDHRLNKKLLQLIVPDSLKQQVLLGIHDRAGHQGRVRTLSLARERFFWNGMEKDVANYVHRCEVCRRKNTWTGCLCIHSFIHFPG